MKVYDLLVKNGFIDETSLYDDDVLAINQNEFLLDFLNREGFIVVETLNRLGLDDTFIYEYGCDSYAGRIKIIFKKDLTNKLRIIFKCPKPEDKE